jgi:hypothetical protein
MVRNSGSGSRIKYSFSSDTYTRNIREMGAFCHICLLLLLKRVFPPYSHDEPVGDEEYRIIGIFVP